MNSKIVSYYDYATTLQKQGLSSSEILDKLKLKGIKIAIAIKTMEKLGVSLDDIDKMIKKSELWKNDFTSFEDLFFDFVELDDDNIC